MNKSIINAMLNNKLLRPSEIRIIHFSNGEEYVAKISRELDDPKRPTRYEVKVDMGIPTGETDPFGDVLTYSWVLSCENVNEAVERFVDRIEEIREEYGYYELSYGFI